MKTSDLTGTALDRAVALALNLPNAYLNAQGNPAPFSKSWSHGGPIIEREKIDLHHHRHGDLSVGWDATIDSWDSEHSGPTPLIAAMRCYVASKLGDEVDLP